MQLVENFQNIKEATRYVYKTARGQCGLIRSEKRNKIALFAAENSTFKFTRHTNIYATY